MIIGIHLNNVFIPIICGTFYAGPGPMVGRNKL